MLKGNGHQERNFGKIFERTANNQRLSQSQQQPQVTDIQEQEIKMNINLPYVEGTTEKLWLVLRPHKIRSIFYTESKLRKLLYKPTDLLAREDKKMTFVKGTAVTAKQFTLVNLNGLQKHV